MTNQLISFVGLWKLLSDTKKKSGISVVIRHLLLVGLSFNVGTLLIGVSILITWEITHNKPNDLLSGPLKITNWDEKEIYDVY